MPFLTASYPSDAPEFIRARPAPKAWQEKVQKINRNLWVAWNPHDPRGQTWCIVKHHGKQIKRGGAFLLGLDFKWNTLLNALKCGWTFIDSCFTPNGLPFGLDNSYADTFLEPIRRGHDVSYGLGNRRKAEQHLAAAHATAKDVRKEASDAIMSDAFQKSLADERTDNTIFAKPPLPTRREKRRRRKVG